VELKNFFGIGEIWQIDISFYVNCKVMKNISIKYLPSDQVTKDAKRTARYEVFVRYPNSKKRKSWGLGLL
jgi:hypothetical protein